ncbi:Isochorismatase family protein [Chryseobacterium carnipullorum]|uniref:isochorismatase family protein n=1 Tax=Chryseobacterium carnipullorum TaxID=1124835 RepID=UPI000912ECAD|nr:isochorismatase family protein [Chryseobacterium carnipullorum]SHL77019.1 Isochorismatase family protein [Chryseobacterium carnipullorum]
MMTDVCLNSTTRAAFDFGFKNTIIGDPTAKRDRIMNVQMVKAADIQRSFLVGISALGNSYTAIMNTADF